MRHLAIDYGTRRIGLAISDDEGRLATPLEVIQVSSPAQAVGRIVHLVGDERVERIVVGLPLNMDDTIGPAAREVMRWANELSRQAHVGVVFVDERLSSFAAQEQLTQRRRAGERLTRQRTRARLDALAAAGFLQALLDGKVKPVVVDR
jgi:putative Holliday junction resolvase